MQTITKKIQVALFVLLISFCVNTVVIGQTPADDPGIGGPGTSGSSPAGDGAPIVPFDNNLNLLFLGTAFFVALKSGKRVF
jgi:hypothetical protein